ncbi:AEC family transporter [Rhizobium laguerreae]|uniref:AEC family transporter n=1 Tax=Rhizobium laguerreae TaxID=1076926 RepID=UPI001C9268AC|nr:AEC family transporter [Rhizobium laguerreae]MBY3537543.1 AEC family transporter [Rhizobium laguerreae]
MANTILLALTPIFFVMALGYGAGRWNIVDNHHVDGLNVLVMNFALPASLFAATASASRAEMYAQAPLFVILSGVMLFVFVGWYLFQVRFRKTGKADASLQALTIAFPNLAGVGLPILADVIGPAGTIPLAVALAAGSIVISPLALVLVELNVERQGVSPAAGGSKAFGAVWHALTKPVVIAPALGIIFSLAELPTGKVVEASLLLIGHAAPGVALFLTGVVLSSQAFQLNWKVVNATIVADLVRPLLTASIVLLLPISSDTAKVAILLAAVPSGFFGILFAVNYRLDSGTTGSMVIASTISSIVTLAIAIALLYPH